MNNFRSVSLPVALLTGIIWAVAPAAAEDDPLAAFRQCGAINDTGQRLACFDSALAKSATDAAKRRIRRAQRAKEDFGLSAPQLVEREREQRSAGVEVQAGGETEPKQIEAAVSEVFTDGNGKRVFLLANGQMWRETTGSSYSGILRNGWKAIVRKGGIGGFRLTFEGRTGFFKVERVR